MQKHNVTQNGTSELIKASPDECARIARAINGKIGMEDVEMDKGQAPLPTQCGYGMQHRI